MMRDLAGEATDRQGRLGPIGKAAGRRIAEVQEVLVGQADQTLVEHGQPPDAAVEDADRPGVHPRSLRPAVDARSLVPSAGWRPPTSLIPREVLFGNPERTSPKISPDGRRIAYLAPVAGVLNVWVWTGRRSRPGASGDRRLRARHPLPFLGRGQPPPGVSAGHRRRRELARAPGRPGRRGVARRHAVRRRPGAAARQLPAAPRLGGGRPQPARPADPRRLSARPGHRRAGAPGRESGFVPWAIDDELRPRGGIRQPARRLDRARGGRQSAVAGRPRRRAGHRAGHLHQRRVRPLCPDVGGPKRGRALRASTSSRAIWSRSPAIPPTTCRTWT